MTILLTFDIRRQPDAVTCGPTCLHALYRYYGDSIDLDDVIDQVASWQKDGTLAVYLAIHALRQGYSATILPFNLTVFDPTWRDIDSSQMAQKLEAQLPHKKGRAGFEEVTRAYLEYLALGGRIQFRVITPALIRKYLKAGIPILTGLSATYLYECPREREQNGRWIEDDVSGDSCGHFVVLSGYNMANRQVRVADPLVPNPMAGNRYYDVDIYRLVCAVLLGILTYDGNLLIIKKKNKN